MDGKPRAATLCARTLTETLLHPGQLVPFRQRRPAFQPTAQPGKRRSLLVRPAGTCTGNTPWRGGRPARLPELGSPIGRPLTDGLLGIHPNTFTLESDLVPKLGVAELTPQRAQGFIQDLGLIREETFEFHPGLNAGATTLWT